jgi:hypothetical protein
VTSPWIAASIGMAVSWTVAVAAPRPREDPDTAASGSRRSWTWPLLLFGAMILGILARYAWEALERTGTIETLDVPALVRPLLVSPMVFFPVWSQASGRPRSLAAVLVAFQNGFFWQAIFERAA